MSSTRLSPISVLFFILIITIRNMCLAYPGPTRRLKIASLKLYHVGGVPNWIMADPLRVPLSYRTLLLHFLLFLSCLILKSVLKIIFSITSTAG